jgi:hypothetical protein
MMTKLLMIAATTDGTERCSARQLNFADSIFAADSGVTAT